MCIRDRFAGEVFRFTATLANLKQNENILYEIGYHVGMCVYLIDSCIDILDDVEKQQFNALLSAYQDSNGFSATRSQHEVVRMVIDSLRTIQTLTKQLTLYQHQSLLEGILLQGFPSRLHQQVHKTIQKLEKNTFIPLNYLPHAALASALCLFATEANAIEFVWGEENYDWKVYGCKCSEDKNCEMCCNPCAYVIDRQCETGGFCCNMLKYSIFNGIVCHLQRESFSGYFLDSDTFCKNYAIVNGIFIALFFAIAISYNFISESYENYLVRSEMEEKEESIRREEESIRREIEDKKESINSFVENTSPELHLNIQKINNSITAINTKIQNLQKLQSRFPAQTDVIQPQIAKLNKLKNHLEETSRNIQVQIRTAYVIQEANKIEGIGQSISLDEILKQANNALQHARNITSSVEEMTQ